MKKVYIIMSPEGGISLKIGTGKGEVYADKQKAETALASTNAWARSKGYGKHILITLEVIE